jgi:hypothetical protein
MEFTKGSLAHIFGDTSKAVDLVAFSRGAVEDNKRIALSKNFTSNMKSRGDRVNNNYGRMLCKRTAHSEIVVCSIEMRISVSSSYST